MSVELSIIIKDEERTLKKDFLIYEPITLIESDPIIQKCVKEVMEEFKGEPEDIKLRAMMVFQ
jgi:hypothetical protein